MSAKKIEAIEDATKVFLTGNLCLSDIPERYKYKLNNGKEYVSIVIRLEDEVHEYKGFKTTHVIGAVTRGRKLIPYPICRLTEWVNEAERSAKLDAIYSKKKEEPADMSKFQKRQKEKDDIIDNLPF